MIKNIKFSLLLLAMCIALIPLSAVACPITAQDQASGGRCVDLGGYQLYMRIVGQTKHAVIFDSGSGDDSSVWNKVAPEVAQFSRVILYDRTGLGKSQPKPNDKPITAQDSVDRLRLLLKKEKINPPYILVGHSQGGLNMQLFAEEHPRDIAGVVLVDSVSRNQTLHDPFASKSEKSYLETITFDEDRKQVKNAGKFPSIPLIVLTATNHPGRQENEMLWQKWQKEIVQLSPKGIQMIAWGSHHYIQKQQPQLVDLVGTSLRSFAHPTEIS